MIIIVASIVTPAIFGIRKKIYTKRTSDMCKQGDLGTKHVIYKGQCQLKRNVKRKSRNNLALFDDNSECNNFKSLYMIKKNESIYNI